MGQANNTFFQVEFSRSLFPINDNDADFTNTNKVHHVVSVQGDMQLYRLAVIK